SQDWLMALIAAKIISQLAAACKASARLLGHGLQADRLQVARDAIIETAWWSRFIMQDLVQEHAGCPAERQLAGEHLIEDDTKTINIALAVDFVTLAAR